MQCIAALPLPAMNIAVNTRFLLPGRLEGIGNFTHEVLMAMVRQHTEHRFHFFFDRPYDPAFILGKNVEGHVLSPAARHPLLWRYWFDMKVPRMLKNVDADVFLSPDGFCSLTTKRPQCLVVHDLGFLHYPDFYTASHERFYRRRVPKFIRKANAVAAVSQFTKDDIVKHYRTPAEKIDVVYNGVKPVFQPLDFGEQDKVKAQFTGGCEYFLHTGAIQPRKNLVNLLKGFSIFKKRLQSSMKLVLCGRMAWKNEGFLQLLQTYKYRDDVVLTGYLPDAEVAMLTASAYAVVYPSVFEGFGVPVAEAMACAVPVLTTRGSAMEEVAQNAGLYFDAANFNDIGEKLMLIYKDETLRKKLIENGRSLAPAFTWERTAALLWQCLVKAAGKENA